MKRENCTYTNYCIEFFQRAIFEEINLSQLIRVCVVLVYICRTLKPNCGRNHSKYQNTLFKICFRFYFTFWIMCLVI